MVTVRYWAAAREAAGIPEESLAVSTCAGLVDELSTRGDKLAKVLQISSFLVDGRRCGAWDEQPLSEASVVEVLPPFAGG